MKENTFERVDEKLYSEVLDNGIRVFLYPTKKTKNFYISISVKYGAKVTKYKLNDKIYDIIPGSAHFLEHKVMALSENKEISKRINELGSLANAWTSYEGTNYNIFGSINIIENLKILLDLFYNTDINEKNVEEEKGIIGEEIDMYKDEINSYIYSELYKNLFNKSYVRNTVVGERSDIEKITSESLNRVYSHFYTSNNTFIIVTGDFDKDEIMNVIKDYIVKLNLKPKKLPKVIKEKEPDKVSVAFEEISKNMNDVRVRYALKMKKNIFGIKDDEMLRYYMSIILSNNFSATSPLFEKYKNENIASRLSYSFNIVDDHVVIIISSVCSDANIFIDNISKDIKKMTLNESEFERKKKMALKIYVTSFDNIEDIEYDLCSSILYEDKINYHEYSDLMSTTYKEAKRILETIDYSNISIIRTSK